MRLGCWLLGVLLCGAAIEDPKRRGAPPRNITVQVPVTLNANSATKELSKHAMVFIGGVPQSGTSFLRTLVASSPFISGQDKCLATTRCWVSQELCVCIVIDTAARFPFSRLTSYSFASLVHTQESNIEGQWLIDANKATRPVKALYLSASVENARGLEPTMLTERNITKNVGPALFANWARYWDVSQAGKGFSPPAAPLSH